MINELKALKFYFREQAEHYARLRNGSHNDQTTFNHYQIIFNKCKNLCKFIDEFLNYIQGRDKK